MDWTDCTWEQAGEYIEEQAANVAMLPILSMVAPRAVVETMATLWQSWADSAATWEHKKTKYYAKRKIRAGAEGDTPGVLSGAYKAYRTYQKVEIVARETGGKMEAVANPLPLTDQEIKYRRYGGGWNKFREGGRYMFPWADYPGREMRPIADNTLNFPPLAIKAPPAGMPFDSIMDLLPFDAAAREQLKDGVTLAKIVDGNITYADGVREALKRVVE